MPQWSRKSLTILICSFSGFLFVFNFFASFKEPISYYEPFKVTRTGFKLKTQNLKRWNYPISIIKYAENQTAQHKLTIFCNAKQLYSNYIISTAIPFTLGIHHYCSDYTFYIDQLLPETLLFFKFQQPKLNLFIVFSKIIFSAIIFISFYRLFSLGKNLSVLRSVLIIQVCVVMMLDPIEWISIIFPTFRVFHYILFCFGWWRCTCEIFSEYIPLLRQKTSLFKYTITIPLFSLIFSFFFRNRYSQNFLAKKALVILSLLSGTVVPTLGLWFIFKAGNTTGRSALIIHIFSGVIAMSAVYFIEILYLSFENEMSFNFPFIGYSIEASFLVAYAMFQTIFKVGQTNDESEQYLPHQQQQEGNHKYEKIEELLENLEAIDDNVKFELPE